MFEATNRRVASTHLICGATISSRQEHVNIQGDRAEPGRSSQIRASAKPAFSTRPARIIFKTDATVLVYMMAAEMDCNSAKFMSEEIRMKFFRKGI